MTTRLPPTAEIPTQISKIAEAFKQSVVRTAGPLLFSFFLAATPSPASRPRVGRWGTYYGKTYEKFRKDASAALAKIEGLASQTSDPLIVVLEVVSPKPKTGTLKFPRGDVDNFAKGPLDVITKSQKFWRDDTSIVGLAVTKRYASPTETPGIQVHAYKLEP